MILFPRVYFTPHPCWLARGTVPLRATGILEVSRALESSLVLVPVVDSSSDASNADTPTFEKQKGTGRAW